MVYLYVYKKLKLVSKNIQKERFVCEENEKLLGMDIPYQEYLQNYCIDNRAYIIHRVGSRMEHEKLYGIYYNVGVAEYKLNEIIENILQEGSSKKRFNPKVERRDKNRCIIRLYDPLLPLQVGAKKIRYYYTIKPVHT